MTARCFLSCSIMFFVEVDSGTILYFNFNFCLTRWLADGGILLIRWADTKPKQSWRGTERRKSVSTVRMC